MRLGTCAALRCQLLRTAASRHRLKLVTPRLQSMRGNSSDGRNGIHDDGNASCRWMPPAAPSRMSVSPSGNADGRNCSRKSTWSSLLGFREREKNVKTGVLPPLPALLAEAAAAAAPPAASSSSPPRPAAALPMSVRVVAAARRAIAGTDAPVLSTGAAIMLLCTCTRVPSYLISATCTGSTQWPAMAWLVMEHIASAPPKATSVHADRLGDPPCQPSSWPSPVQCSSQAPQALA